MRKQRKVSFTFLVAFLFGWTQKKVLLQTGYLSGVINYSINDVVNSQQNGPKHPTTTVPQREIFLVLSYLCLQSIRITKQLKACINKVYGFIDLRVIFQSVNRSQIWTVVY